MALIIYNVFNGFASGISSNGSSSLMSNYYEYNPRVMRSTVSSLVLPFFVIRAELVDFLTYSKI